MTCKNCTCECYVRGADDSYDKAYQEGYEDGKHESEGKHLYFRDDGHQLVVCEDGRDYFFDGDTAEIRMGRAVYFLINNHIWNKS